MDQYLNFLMIAEIVVVVALIISILLQGGDESGGMMFGGGGGESFRQKRGLEKVMYYGTIVLAVLFALLSLLIVMFKG